MLRYISDLHLELQEVSYQGLFKSKTQYLALAGDIGNYRQKSRLIKFLNECSSRYKEVFYVPGNHEYYGYTVEETKINLESICDRYPNVHLLDNKSFTLDNGVQILGSTLWTHCPYTPPLNDYKLIKTENGILTIEDTNKLHQENITWLTDHITDRTVVITHHAPLLNNHRERLFLSHPKYRNPTGFHADLPELVAKAKVWIFGHTHYCNQTKFRNTRILTNQYGYQENLKVDFSAEINLDDIIVDSI